MTSLIKGFFRLGAVKVKLLVLHVQIEHLNRIDNSEI